MAGRADLRRRLHLAAQPRRPRARRACLAQLVNAIAPIMTETGGPAWRQTIFYPFAQMSNLGRGRGAARADRLPDLCGHATTIRAAPRSTTIPLPAVPYLKLAAVHDEAGRRLTLFALNRHLDQEMPLDVDRQGLRRAGGGGGARAARRDLEAVNTKDEPERIKPAPLEGVTVEGGRLRATLAPASWNVIRLGRASGAPSITTSVRTSMLSRGGAPAGVSGRSNAPCGVKRARPSARLSQPLISSTSSGVIAGA